MSVRHFLTLNDFRPEELQRIIERAVELKDAHRNGQLTPTLQGRTLAMLFEKASTRTRVSFEAGMAQLGGHALFLAPGDTQLGRGETIEDTARVISRMVDAVMIRNHSQTLLERFAEHSRVPVINALTDRFHPCQLMADMQTWIEARGRIAGCTAAWIGDGNNMCQSYIHAARQFGFSLRIATPPGYEPDADIVERGGAAVRLGNDPAAAVDGVDLVITDTWTSMGGDHERDQRLTDFAGFQVNAALMARAAPDALFMHCLPAHRGEEVTDEVIDGPQSLVWEEAENRLHVQKALLEFLIRPVTDPG
ncbi:MAG: ornithine carbamoyltransferase [Salinisphaeraceae bacterium]